VGGVLESALDTRSRQPKLRTNRNRAVVLGFPESVRANAKGKMFVIPYLVDWNEATRRHKDGRLSEYAAAAERKEAWLKELDLLSSSNAYYCTVADAWEAIRGAKAVPAKTAAKAKDFMNRLITFQNYQMDLRGANELFSLTISPATAAKLAKAAKGLDWLAYKDVYYAKCPDDTKDYLAEHTDNVDPERSFEMGFIPYVRSWAAMIDLAAKKKMGLLVAMY